MPSSETIPLRNPDARILVVDDDTSTREVFGELLQRWGYQVEQTSDGHDALKLAAELHPDVIITDLVMPKLDGLALARASSSSCSARSRSGTSSTRCRSSAAASDRSTPASVSSANRRRCAR